MEENGLNGTSSLETDSCNAKSSITRKIGETQYVLNSYLNADKSKGKSMLWHVEKLLKSEIISNEALYKSKI